MVTLTRLFLVFRFQLSSTLSWCDFKYHRNLAFAQIGVQIWAHLLDQFRAPGRRTLRKSAIRLSDLAHRSSTQITAIPQRPNQQQGSPKALCDTVILLTKLGRDRAGEPLSETAQSVTIETQRCGSAQLDFLREQT